MKQTYSIKSLFQESIGYLAIILSFVILGVFLYFVYKLGLFLYGQYGAVGIIGPVALFSIIAIIGFGIRIYIRERERQREFEKSRYEEERKLRERQGDEIELIMKRLYETTESQVKGVGSGGYIILDLPHEKRSLFYDLLKGFEEYAKLKGYTIFFSIDNSFPDTVAFKFTLGDNGITVSTEMVRKDIKEYIDRIQKGKGWDDMPIILIPEEHNLILTALKNRLNFLEHNYKLQKNIIEFYDKFFKKLNSSPHGILPYPSVFVQTGGVHSPKSYLIENSSNVTQGEKNVHIDDSIKIAESFNERKLQIENLEKLIDMMKSDSIAKLEGKNKAVINLQKVKRELEDEDKPDIGNIKKWLEKTKSYIELAQFGKEVITLAKSVFLSFGLNLPF